MTEIESKFYARMLRRALRHSWEECDVRVEDGTVRVYPTKKGYYIFGRACETVYAFARAFNLGVFVYSQRYDNDMGCRPFITLR